MFLFLALLTFNSMDPGWSYIGTDAETKNLVGRIGAWVADVCLFFFGYLAFLFPVVVGFQAWEIFRDRNLQQDFNYPFFIFRSIGFLLTLVAGAGIASLHFYDLEVDYPNGSGGVVGMELSDLLEPVFSYVGTTLIFLSVLFFGITAFLDLSWISLMERVGGFAITGTHWFLARLKRFINFVVDQYRLSKSKKKRKERIEKQVEINERRVAPVIEPVADKMAEESKRSSRERQGNLFKIDSVEGLPALHLLDDNEERAVGRGYSDDDLKGLSRLLELKLRDYGIEAEVSAVFPGPVITRFEIQPAPGVKVSRISSLAKDLARSLAVISVRVVEVIPGKSVVGIEIPNVDRDIVKMSEVLKSAAYDESQSALSLALGQDISGIPIVQDLAKMPHLLVAGTTGSGKSVGLNAMILSLLFKSSPEDVRMIMVDPKMLELAVYEGIPHLLTPVVTDMKDAANALRWCVAEMERRYRLMASLGVRNVGGFNRKIKDAVKAGNPLRDPLWVSDFADEETLAPELETLPYIVVIIDEFADMMMIVGKKVEELIARIAQKARAAGIHLVLATQRPSVDVITGLIKANIPSRIAFQVSSKVDSRTILDQGGAEQLLGHGDMLYLAAGSPLPVRVHGAFVDDDEVHRVVQSWKKLGEPNYLETILEGATDSQMIPGISSNSEGQGVEDESDPFYDEAVQFVTETRRASISAVQRKFRIGYNRAARIIETMESAGLVSEMNASGSREVLANAPPN
ncbi:MAG: cell division protein FtsK [Gammaproteobacteria bacterium]|nr:cell division protein FtsK [Gammaproteobacteria bacterium]